MCGVQEFDIGSIYHNIKKYNTVVRVAIRKHVLCMNFEKKFYTNTICKELENKIRKETSFWKIVLQRLFDIILTLAKSSLALRGHREDFSQEGYHGNFLFFIELVARYDHILRQVLDISKVLCFAKCFSEETKWSNPIKECSNETLFEVTGYPSTGDIPLLNRKIFRGTRVNVREHPYIVSIRRNTGHYLTGTLITSNLVLTLAHPIVHVPIQELRVVAGESYSDRGTSLLTVVIILIHEDFDPFTLVADLSILRIYEDLVFKSSIKSISLVMSQMILQGTAFVTGWGRCDFTGNELCLPRTSQYYPDEKVDPMLRSVSLTIDSQNYYCEGYKRHEVKIGVGMECVGGAREDNPVCPCLAVPGAPLVVKAKLAGILSWGFGCGYLHDLPLIYTSTQHYTSWIAENVVVFKSLSKKDFSELFQATKSYMILEWLSKTRVSMPVPHEHPNFNKELHLIKLDEELAKLQGSTYDIRDYMFEGEFHDKKLLLYDVIKKALIENITSAEVNYNASNIFLTHSKPRPFFSNKSLLDISVTYEDFENSDDD